jgi:hypothetical protein
MEIQVLVNFLISGNGSLSKLTMHLTKLKYHIINCYTAAFLSIAVMVMSCQNTGQAVTATNGDMLEIVDSTYQSGTGWGYKIYVGGHIYITQPFIPGIPGKNYFLTEADARKVSTLVVQKIIKHQIPPTVSGNELRALNIIK